MLYWIISLVLFGLGLLWLGDYLFLGLFGLWLGSDFLSLGNDNGLSDHAENLTVAFLDDSEDGNSEQFSTGGTKIGVGPGELLILDATQSTVVLDLLFSQDGEVGGVDDGSEFVDSQELHNRLEAERALSTLHHQSNLLI